MATTIRIDDTPHPLHPTKSNDNGPDNVGVDDGIYNMRDFTRTATASSGLDRDGIFHMRGISRTFSRSSSRDKDKRGLKGGDGDPEDDDPGLLRSGDFKSKQIFHGKLLWWLAYQSIGVIYGDIGTSPLYVYSSTFTAPPVKEDLVGVLSIILWTLTMMVTVKYVLIILRADNNGEGGTFSTYSLLSRYVNITNRDPREASLIEMKRYGTGDLEKAGQHMRRGLERSKVAKTLLKIMGVLAVSMVMSDGVLTPAQSVLGAVQGLEVVVPNISKSTIIGTTAAILILLFVIQPFGTSKIATTFAPIVIIWLAFNAVFGIYNLAKFDATVLKAFNPGFAFEYLIRTKSDGWRSLGGILLAFTGVEALFADLGAFSRKAIQISWLGYTFPCLLLAYSGQAAYISVHPDAYSNPFFKAAPPGTVYPALIMAILAAVVASQAIITATFQLLAQIMKLSYFPQIKVVHTSKIFHGQLYVPLVNWLLMIGTVLVAAIFNNTTSLGNAYGVCVMFVTFFDTCMVSLAAIFVWRISPYLVVLPWLTIACMDGAYLSSALTKVPAGAWFTITLAAILATLFILWRFGKEQQWAAEAADHFPTTHFVKQGDEGPIQLKEVYGGQSLSTIKSFGIFFDKGGGTTPPVFSQFVIKLVAAPEVIVLFHLRPLETPSVAPEDRYTVSRLAIRNGYRLIVRHGYNDEVITPDLASLIREQIHKFIRRSLPGHSEDTEHQILPETHLVPRTSAENTTQTPSSQTSDSSPPPDKDPNFPTNPDNTSTTQDQDQDQDPSLEKLPLASSNWNGDDLPAQLAKLDEAYNHQVLYIIGKEQMKITPGTGIFRRTLLQAFLWIRDNTRTKIANLRVPMDRVFEVGFVKDI